MTGSPAYGKFPSVGGCLGGADAVCAGVVIACRTCGDVVTARAVWTEDDADAFPAAGAGRAVNYCPVHVVDSEDLQLGRLMFFRVAGISPEVEGVLVAVLKVDLIPVLVGFRPPPVVPRGSRRGYHNCDSQGP